MDCSMPGSLLGSSAHGISRAKILEWVVTSFSRGSFQLRDQARVSCIGRWILYHWATSKAQSVRFSACNAVKWLMSIPGWIRPSLVTPDVCFPTPFICDPLAVSWPVYTCFCFTAFVPEVPSVESLLTSLRVSLSVILTWRASLIIVKNSHSLLPTYTYSSSCWRRKRNRLYLESRTPCWIGLWTLSSMPSIYGNGISTGKSGPWRKSPGLVPRLFLA